MSNDLSLPLDGFGQAALGRFERPGSGWADAAVRTASLYYMADRDSGRAGWAVPTFAPHDGKGTLTVTLDDATWTVLTDEAERQGVPTETLAVHALLYFLADLEDGRVADLLGRALERSG